MQATDGMRGALRWHGRRGACCVAIAFALCAVFAASASAMEHYTQKRESYLALGDSLAFGYSQEIYNLLEKQGDPAGPGTSKGATSFERGYATFYFNKINKGFVQRGHKYKKPVLYQNLACPGETTASLIGNGEAGTIMESSLGATTEAPCAYQEVFSSRGIDGLGGPLHTGYSGMSQLEKAAKTVFEDQQVTEIEPGVREPERPPKAITIDIGLSDELPLKSECASASEGLLPCVEKGIAKIAKNVYDIVYVLRHATLLGWPEQADYNGPITLIAPYDPFGVLKGNSSKGHAEQPFPWGCKTEEEEKHTQVCIPNGGEYVAGSNLLAHKLRVAEEEELKTNELGTLSGESAFKGPLNVCVDNLQSIFNLSWTAKEKAAAEHKELTAPQALMAENREATKLETYTNMLNRTGVTKEGNLKEFAGAEGEKADGLDIDPTVKGSHVIAKSIAKTCPVNSAVAP